MTEKFWKDGAANPPLVNEVSWTYDNLNRVTAEDFNSTDDSLDYNEHFTYDLSSNRISDVRDVGRDGTVDISSTSTFDANDRLLSEVKATNSSSTVTTYGYDNTQQTSKVVIEGTSFVSGTDFAYDLSGRLTIATLTQFTNGTASTIERTTYAYNSSGIRTSATTETDSNADGTTETAIRTEFLNDANNQTGYSQVIRESQFSVVNGTSTVTQTIDYTFGHTQISQTTKQYDANGSVTSYVVRIFGHDGHGSVRVLTDMLGALVQMYAFDAFGQMVGLWNASGQLISGGNGQYADAKLAVTNLLYSGEQFDTRIGQQYLRARYYDPSTGRFTSLDPFYGNQVDPLSFHKYLYTQANPVGAIDPSGWFSAGEVMSSLNIQMKQDIKNAWAAFEIYDKFDSIKGVLQFAATVMTGGQWSWLQGLGLLIDFLPLGKIVSKLKLLKGFKVARSGVLDKTTDIGKEFLDDLNKAFTKADIVMDGMQGADKVYDVANAVGSAAAVTIAAAKGFKPTKFRSTYKGIDGLFQDEVGNFIVIEAKGGGGVIRGPQMSQKWINDNVKKMLDEAPTYGVPSDEILALKTALADGKIQGMVVKAPYDSTGTLIGKVEYKIKYWNEILPFSWD